MERTFTDMLVVDIGVRNVESENQTPPKTEPELRVIIIATDGVGIKVEKNELTGLEVCEMCRRLLVVYGGAE